MPPNIEQRLKSLESKHKALDKQIEQLYKHTSAELSIKKLKKEKLDKDTSGNEGDIVNGEGYVVTDRNSLLEKLKGLDKDK